MITFGMKKAIAQKGASSAPARSD
eukprot:COSAG02_NODE_64304_length_261_cov_0.518519_1_plen_23_part_10